MLVYHYHSEPSGILNTGTFHTNILSSSISEKNPYHNYICIVFERFRKLNSHNRNRIWGCYKIFFLHVDENLVSEKRLNDKKITIYWFFDFFNL